MIEKLPDWPEGYTPPEHVNEALVWLKLNEVIDAVNRLDNLITGAYVLQATNDMLREHSQSHD